MSLHVKTSDSTSLPIFNSLPELPRAIVTKRKVETEEGAEKEHDKSKTAKKPRAHPERLRKALRLEKTSKKESNSNDGEAKTESQASTAAPVSGTSSAPASIKKLNNKGAITPSATEKKLKALSSMVVESLGSKSPAISAAAAASRVELPVPKDQTPAPATSKTPAKASKGTKSAAATPFVTPLGTSASKLSTPASVSKAPTPKTASTPALGTVTTPAVAAAEKAGKIGAIVSTPVPRSSASTATPKGDGGKGKAAPSTKKLTAEMQEPLLSQKKEHQLVSVEATATPRTTPAKSPAMMASSKSVAKSASSALGTPTVAAAPSARKGRGMKQQSEEEVAAPADATPLRTPESKKSTPIAASTRRQKALKRLQTPGSGSKKGATATPAGSAARHRGGEK